MKHEKNVSCQKIDDQTYRRQNSYSPPNHTNAETLSPKPSPEIVGIRADLILDLGKSP